MEEKRNNAFFQKAVEGVLVAGVILILLSVVLGLREKTTSTEKDRISALSEGWYYLEQEKKVEVQLPAVFTAREGEEITLFNDSISQEDAGKTITTKGALYRIKMTWNDQVLYQYSDEYFPRNDQMKSKLDCYATLPTDTEEGTLALTYTFGEGGTYRIGEVYIGSDSAVMNYRYAHDAFTIGLVFMMALLAVLAFCVAVYLYRIKMYDCRFFHVAIFLILCGLWCATDSSLVQNVTGLSPITCVISFYAFMLLAIPMLHFLQNTGELKKYRILFWLRMVFYVNAILQGILNYLHIFEFIEMLFVTHLLLFVSVMIASWILIKEYREKRERETKIILWAFLMLATGGLTAIVLYWLLEIPWYGTIFECGILVYVVLLMAGIISTMTENIRFKTEMLVYRRLAKEDRLTGLKNRRAYEEYLTELQSKADTYENMVLIFMDLNQLKHINDCFGHNAGDELLIASARCIENAFGAEGECYRIGGDEFCVIIENPTKTEREWYKSLDAEIQMYNKNGRYYMSIARGLSYLRDEKGALKTISDWKYEADLKMYKNKGRTKRL